MAGHHLAQLNVGTLRHPLDDPRTHGFTSMLDTLNDVADRSPGFVWRLVGDESNDATAIRTTLGADVIVNMSVWESRDSLWDYVYRSGHLDVLRRRAEWFELPKTAFQVMWWIPAGHVPTVEEAVERLQHLRAHGPSPRAFGFRDTYTPEDAGLGVATTDGHDQGPDLRLSATG
ncbi:DUF3291 domain-containing protein [Actinosynnema sp. NPDC050801]|uniref:DUF3291 domain-containing protein n=1 Tax=unclassified Actinosynnema TaxID=2637065 RepID=UPI0033CA0CDC